MLIRPHICVLIIVMHEAIWFVKTYKTLRVVLVVVLNANFFHFYQLHPYPSPGTGKYYHLKKRRKIALFHGIGLFIAYKMTILSVYIL